MASPEIDPDNFRDEQRAAWDSVAAAWRRWWPSFESAAQPLNERLVELSGAESGSRVLDVACGIGEPSLTAAGAVGPTGHVLGTDLAPQMLGLARERASEMGYANLELIERDAHELDLPEAEFDAAVSRWGLMLMLEPERCLAGILHALQPGARLAVSVWSTPEQAPFLRIPRDVALHETGQALPDPDAPGPFRLAADGALASLLERAGFVDVHVEEFPVRFELKSADEYVRFVTELSSSLDKLMQAAPEDVRRRIREGIEAQAADYAGPDGRVVMDNVALCAVAKKPSPDSGATT